MPQISIVIPIYNVELYLQECLDSICKQSFRDIEIILVDDGSIDGSVEISKLYAEKDSRIQVICQQNAGPSAARNKGIRKASGEWVVFVDSDDFFCEKTFLSKLNSTIRNNKADMIIYGATRKNGDHSQIIYEGLAAINNLPVDKQIKWLISHEKFAASPWMRAIKKNFLLKKNCFFDETFRTGEDIEWMLKIITQQPLIVGMNSHAYCHQVRPDSLCTQARKSKFWKNRYRGIMNGIEYINEHRVSKEYKNAVLGYIAYLYYVLIAEIAEEPDKRQKKEGVKDCKELLWLRSYATGKKAKLSRVIVDFFGLVLGGNILNWRVKQRRKIG